MELPKRLNLSSAFILAIVKNVSLYCCFEYLYYDCSKFLSFCNKFAKTQQAFFLQFQIAKWFLLWERWKGYFGDIRMKCLLKFGKQSFLILIGSITLISLIALFYYYVVEMKVNSSISFKQRQCSRSVMKMLSVRKAVLLRRIQFCYNMCCIITCPEYT